MKIQFPNNTIVETNSIAEATAILELANAIPKTKQTRVKPTRASTGGLCKMDGKPLPKQKSSYCSARCRRNAKQRIDKKYHRRVRLEELAKEQTTPIQENPNEPVQNDGIFT